MSTTEFVPEAAPSESEKVGADTITAILDNQPGAEAKIDHNIENQNNNENGSNKPVLEQPKSPPNGSPTPPTTEVKETTSAPTNWEQEKSAYLEKIEALQKRTALVEEFEKDPQSFMSKHVPGIVLKQFDKVGYVANKINEKYGEWKPDSTKMYEVGSPDYQYRLDIVEFEKQADKLVDDAKNAESQVSQQNQQSLEEIKTKVKSVINLTDDVFDQQVWEKLKNVTDVELATLAAKGIIAESKLKEVTNNLNSNPLKNAVAETVMNQSAETKKDADAETLENFFRPSSYGSSHRY